MLVKCRECGNDVSTEAKACPKCGCPVGCPVSDKRWGHKLSFLVLKLLLGVYGLHLLSKGNHEAGCLLLFLAFAMLIVQAIINYKESVNEDERAERLNKEKIRAEVQDEMKKKQNERLKALSPDALIVRTPSGQNGATIVRVSAYRSPKGEDT